MRRWSVIAFVLLLALLPVLHSHALFTDNATQPCGACVAGASDIVVVPSIAAPAVFAYTLYAVVVTTTLATVARTFSPRGPPSAG